MADTVTATAYLVVSAIRRQWGDREVNGAKVMGVRQNKPTKLYEDEVAIKFNVQVPKSVFEPYESEVTAVADAGDVQTPAKVTVESAPDYDQEVESA